MSTLTVDLTDPTPPYEQLRRQLVDHIETGRLAPGERLPPLRQLARDLGLAVGTVGRSYSELESAGLVESRRGAGTRVAARVRPVEPVEQLTEAARGYLARARALGLDDAVAVRLVAEQAGMPAT